ncbi:alginate O-acetyltransferase AlgX-related protein [Methylobacterium sp. ID0610]|uniref:alginate O-acetyltransferase AlgX-related protein n=1 Tax=Methylobacterium carpenticola TaxID=3344827 RepID=UPI003673E24A
MNAGMVHEGRDGWLFLIGGNNDVLTQYRRSWRTWLHDWRWRRVVVARADRCRRLGIRYLHLVVPEKLTVYDNLTDGLAVDVSASPAHRLRRWLRGSGAAGAYIDLVAPMRARRDEQDLYFRTDTHWTHEGCFIAYEAICRRLGAVPREDLRSGRALPAWRLSGDLGQKFDPPRSEPYIPQALQRDAVRVYANDLVRDFEAADRIGELHLGTHVVYRNEAPGADPRRIVLFGDSCSHFRWGVYSGHLTGLLAETFSEVHFLWSPGIDWDYVAQVRPDAVIGEFAERFLARLPPKTFRRAALARLVRERKGMLQPAPA